MKLYFSDEDGDLITFSSQEELNEAMVNGTEELTVYIQGKYLLQITYYKIIKPCTLFLLQFEFTCVNTQSKHNMAISPTYFPV